MFWHKHFPVLPKASRTLATGLRVIPKSRRILAIDFREFPKVCCNLVTSFREAVKGCCNLQEAFGKIILFYFLKLKNRQKTAGDYVKLFQIMPDSFYHIAQIKRLSDKFIRSGIEC
jgi:hypothetical protein